MEYGGASEPIHAHPRAFERTRAGRTPPAGPSGCQRWSAVGQGARPANQIGDTELGDRGLRNRGLGDRRADKAGHPSHADGKRPSPGLAAHGRFWPLASTPCTPGSLHTQIKALHIQELLPHHSIGLQPYYYLKNGSEQPIWRLFRAENAVGSLLKILKLCEFMYLTEFTVKFVIYLTKNRTFSINF
jgi:hypothetical protein